MLGLLVLAALRPLTAFAGTPVVHDVAAPAEVVKPWPEDAEPVRFRELVVGAPALRSGEDVVVCADLPPLGELPKRLEGAVSYGALDEAEGLYGDAIERLPCDPAVTSEALGRIGMLGGITAARRGEADTARLRFTEARTWHPSVAWSDDWPPDLRETFDSAAAGAPVALTIIPEGGVRIDGSPASAPARVAPGRHLVRVADQGMWVTVPPVDDALIVPLAYPVDSLGWMGDPTRRADLSALLATALGEGRYALVTDGTTTWAGTTGRTDWVETGGAVRTTDTPTKRSPVGAVLAVGGGVLALAGTAVASEAWLTADRYEKSPDPAWTFNQYSNARTRYTTGLVGAVAGAALAGTGVVVHVAGRF
ncbi:MAG: hypothetical protein H6737_11395 [Alphaproteobacteria bacterium]|nr:hypothetical protein [Alphaproteobacteria bacterium]